MNSFPKKYCPNQWSHLGRTPISRWYRTFASKWDLENSWWKFRIVEKFFPMNVAAFIVAAMNILQIIECSSPESATFDILSCLFRTWSLTSISNSAASLPVTKFLESATSCELILSSCPDDHELSLRSLRIAQLRREEFLRDEDELVVPYSKKFVLYSQIQLRHFPWRKFRNLSSSWYLALSSYPDPSWIISLYHTDCAFPSRGGSSWCGRTCCIAFQEVSWGFPDWSCAPASLFHSWEDKERS